MSLKRHGGWPWYRCWPLFYTALCDSVRRDSLILSIRFLSLWFWFLLYTGYPIQLKIDYLLYSAIFYFLMLVLLLLSLYWRRVLWR
ncbi:Uncharacterised protein [Vibrio cholerae]|nr:Uncharacterised protein [Vibrio cholerae]